MRSTLIVVSAILNVAVALAQTDSYEEGEVKDGGSVVGQVTFTGTAPPSERLVVSTDTEVCGKETLSRALLVGADGGVKNAVANLRRIPRGKKWEDREYTLGQSACRFEPHVLLFRDDADLHILNGDRIAHGVRSYGRDSVFNVGQPKFVEKLLVENFTARVSEQKVIRIGCDLHPWMKSYIVLQKHPYYALSDDSGSFQLTDVPPGQYELELWHETLGERVKKITVEPNGETAVTFELGR